MKRIWSAMVMFPLVLIVFILGNKYVVDIFVGIIALRCIHELFHAFEQKGHHPVRWIGYLSAVAIMFLHIIPRKYALITIGAIIPISILLLFVLVLTKKTKTNVIDNYSNINFTTICFGTYQKDKNKCNRYSYYIFWSMLCGIIFNVYVYN